ncbi:MAG: coproporphyrinogen III oxidase [Candidatus Schekmanbacteria bacterium]|nr:coproporphyrinogen III oxidase [Candidatus Schekmanbacteria bacterium]
MNILPKFDDYMTRTKKKALKNFTSMELNPLVQTQTWNVADGFMEVNTIRGKIFEKMGISDSRFETIIPRYNEKTTVRVFEICSHTFNPEVPVGTLSLRFLKRKTGRLMGHTDLSPFLESKKERELFVNAMKSLCRKYRKDYEELNSNLKNLFHSVYRNKQRGGGLGIAFDLNEKDFPLLCETGETFIKIYSKIIDRTKGLKINKKDREAVLAARAQWVEFNLVEDKGFIAGIKIGIPPEAMMVQTLPPLVKF